MYHRSQVALTWHDVIPSDQLWLKLGGDKGHGSFKFNMQLCNVLHPKEYSSGDYEFLTRIYGLSGASGNKVDPRLSAPRLSEPSIIRIQEQMKCLGSKFKIILLHYYYKHTRNVCVAAAAC